MVVVVVVVGEVMAKSLVSCFFLTHGVDGYCVHLVD